VGKDRVARLGKGFERYQARRELVLLAGVFDRDCTWVGGGTGKERGEGSQALHGKQVTRRASMGRPRAAKGASHVTGGLPRPGAGC
jgi:hypothetical protein